MSRLALVLALTFPALQADDLTFSGRVLDPSGATVAGAVVELTGPSGSKVTATDAAGVFQLDGLAAGEHIVAVSSDGFAPARLQAVLDESVSDFVVMLAIEAQTQTLDVQAGAPGAPQPAENQDSVTVRQQDLQALPALDGDVIGALQGLLDDGGALGEGGGLVVDGMETGELGVTPSAIEEVRINMDPYSAEYSRPGRSRIEVITKKGATDYHGQLNFRLRDYRLDARNAFASTRPQQTRRAFEGHLVGPLGNGEKNSLLVSAEHDRDNQSAVVFAETPEGVLRDVVLAPEVETEASFRYNRHASYKRSFSLRYEWERESERNRGVGGFTLPEAASDQLEQDHDLYGSYRYIVGPKLIFQWNGRLSAETSRETSRSDAPSIVVDGAFSAGGAQRWADDREAGVESAAVVSRQGERHYVRAGVQLRDITFNQIRDRDDYGGVYRFGSLEDYVADRPFAFSRREGDPTLAFWDVEAALFVQDNIKLGDRSMLAMGLRYDRQNYTSDPDNFAPRASFAHAPGDERKTTIRLGGGIFYDNVGSGAIEDRLRFNGVRAREILVSDPEFVDPSEVSGAARPPNVVRWAPSLRTPYLAQFGASVERKLDNGLALALSWNRLVGVSLLRSRDVNAIEPGGEERPNPEAGIVRQVESSARLEAHSLTAQARGRIAKVFNGTVRYTYGRALDNVSDDDELPANSWDLSGEWGPAGFDRRRRVDLLGAVEVRDWFQLGFIFEMRSGRPYTLTTGVDSNGDGRTAERPAGVNRNSERGPGSSELDVRVSRTFDTPAMPGAEESTRLTVTLDAFNLLNAVNLGGVVGNLRSPLFGQATSASSARRLQAGLRWSF